MSLKYREYDSSLQFQRSLPFLLNYERTNCALIFVREQWKTQWCMEMNYFKEIYSRGYKNNKNLVGSYCIYTCLIYCQTCVIFVLFILCRQWFLSTLSQWDQFHLILREVYVLNFNFPWKVIYSGEGETLTKERVISSSL